MSTYQSINSYVRRIKRLTYEIMNKTNEPIARSAQWTAMKAIELAPVDTGTLIQEIHWKKSKTNQAWVMQRNPGHKNPNHAGIAFNYAEAMRHPGKTQSRIHSGDPEYMKHAAQKGRKKFKTTIQAHIVRAIKTTR